MAISKAGLEPWVFGNLFIGGLIGLVIDISSGAVSKYDTPITVGIGATPTAVSVPSPESAKPVS